MDIVEYKGLIWVGIVKYLPVSAISDRDITYYSLYIVNPMHTIRVFNLDEVTVVKSNISFDETLEVCAQHVSNLHYKVVINHVDELPNDVTVDSIINFIH